MSDPILDVEPDDMGLWWSQSGIYEQLYREYCEVKPDMTFEEFCEQHQDAR